MSWKGDRWADPDLVYRRRDFVADVAAKIYSRVSSDSPPARRAAFLRFAVRESIALAEELVRQGVWDDLPEDGS